MRTGGPRLRRYRSPFPTYEVGPTLLDARNFGSIAAAVKAAAILSNHELVIPAGEYELTDPSHQIVVQTAQNGVRIRGEGEGTKIINKLGANKPSFLFEGVERFYLGNLQVQGRAGFPNEAIKVVGLGGAPSAFGSFERLLLVPNGNGIHFDSSVIGINSFNVEDVGFWPSGTGSPSFRDAGTRLYGAYADGANVVNAVRFKNFNGVGVDVPATLAVSTVANSGGRYKITTTASHGLSTGDFVTVTGVVGHALINAAWKITVVDADEFTLDDSTFEGAYSSGGTVYWNKSDRAVISWATTGFSSVVIIEGNSELEGFGLSVEIYKVFQFEIRGTFGEHTVLKLGKAGNVARRSAISVYNPAGIFLTSCVQITPAFMGGGNLIVDSGSDQCGAIFSTLNKYVNNGTNEVRLGVVAEGVDLRDKIGGPGLDFGSVQLRTGAGTPEGSITAPVGSLYLRNDGGAGTCLYIKESGVGNTGWVAK